MIFKSIRWRLQAWHGLILVIVLTGFGFTAYHVTRENQLRRIDQELDQSLMTVFRPQMPGHPPEPHTKSDSERHFPDPSDFIAGICEAIRRAGASDGVQTNAAYYVLWKSDGTLLARSPGAPAEVPFPTMASSPEFEQFKVVIPTNGPMPGVMITMNSNMPFPGIVRGAPMGSVARTRGQYRELFHRVPFGGCMLVGRSMAPDLAAMHRLALGLVVAGAGVLLFGLAGGWWLATKAIAPIAEISATALKISGGDLSRRIDVTDTEGELGRLAEILNSTFARLEAAFAHQARFTADASHELRTPLSVILSQSQNALSRERGAAEYRETIEACLRAAQRMRQLTESLLQLARLDAGQEPMKRDRFDLAVVTRESADLVRPLALERHIDIHCELPSLQCVGDPERIGQVVTNLLTNAIHYNREHGEVRISGQTENGSVLLKVADTGEGLAPEAVPHIFERFYRVDKSRSGVRGRTGLGLAICKAILDAHSGTVAVSSEPGVGSVFTVTLPRN